MHDTHRSAERDIAMPVIGWDIGGVNTKVAVVDRGVVARAHAEPYEIQRAPEQLPELLRSLCLRLEASADLPHAITMTAELSQLFRTKRDGVAFVVDAFARAFPHSPLHLYAVGGRFLTPEEARAEPLAVAASNWFAAASIVAARWPDAIFVDVGSTTTDIIPIASGAVVALGKTDPERLAAGELLYLGALRTPVEAIVTEVPLGTGAAGVSAEAFALAGDVHLWRGDLRPEDYTVPTPDSRPLAREFLHERLARVVCGDRELLGRAEIDRMAEFIAATQTNRVAATIARVSDRHPQSTIVVAAGLGDFIAVRAAAQLGMETILLADALGADAARVAPAAAVGVLLDQQLRATR